MKIAVIGAGAWGTALATVCAYNEHEVMLWAHEHETVENINVLHENRSYLPGIRLSPFIQASNDISCVVRDASFLLLSVPVPFLRNVLIELKPYLRPEHILVITCKGIEQETLMLPEQIIDDVCGAGIKKAVIAGPSFAQNVAEKDITGVALAAETNCIAKKVQKVLTTMYFRPYLCEDMIGVQLGSALKNVLALGIGMLDGAYFGDNAKAWLLTLGLREAVDIGYLFGAYKDTFYGLSGVGDLVLTSFGKSSRNVAVGRFLGQGISLENLTQKFPVLPEGINTAKAIHDIIQKNELHAPIFTGMYQVIFEGRSLHDMLAFLMSRSLSSHACCE